MKQDANEIPKSLSGTLKFSNPAKKLIAFVLESPLPGRGGWGNGYVAVPKGHPVYEMDYDAIHDKYKISVNGGLTFSAMDIIGQPEETKGMWIVGFDTLHSHDTPEMWPNSESVMAEANDLKSQLEAISNPAVKEETKHTPEFDYEFVNDALNFYFNYSQKELLKNTLGDIERKNLEAIRQKSLYHMSNNDYYSAMLKENQELKARLKISNEGSQNLEKARHNAQLACNELQALNAELLEALEEAVFMIQGYQVQHGEGPSNKKKLESLKSILNKS